MMPNHFTYSVLTILWWNLPLQHSPSLSLGVAFLAIQALFGFIVLYPAPITLISVDPLTGKWAPFAYLAVWMMPESPSGQLTSTSTSGRSLTPSSSNPWAQTGTQGWWTAFHAGRCTWGATPFPRKRLCPRRR